MEDKKILEQIIFGGLGELNKNSEELRKIQIMEGMKIHTCNNYNNSLEIIKNASIGCRDKLKLISKVYYRYPDLNNVRYRPLINQIDEMVYRLGFVPFEWELQLSCYCNLKELKTINAQEFFKHISSKYGIKKIYLEFYPIYKYKLQDIVNLNKFYNKKIIFGLIGYQNLFNRVFTNNDLKFLSSNSVNVCFIGLLGLGKQNKVLLNNKENSKKNLDIHNGNIFYFLLNQILYNNLEVITEVSSIKHYLDLKKRIFDSSELLQSNDFKNYNEVRTCLKPYYFKDYDHYGGYISFKKYFCNPKLIMYKLKYHLLSFIYSGKFKRNFWG